MISSLADWQIGLAVAVFIGLAMDMHHNGRRPGAPVWAMYVFPVLRTLFLFIAIMLALELA